LSTFEVSPAVEELVFSGEPDSLNITMSSDETYWTNGAYSLVVDPTVSPQYMFKYAKPDGSTFVQWAPDSEDPTIGEWSADASSSSGALLYRKVEKSELTVLPTFFPADVIAQAGNWLGDYPTITLDTIRFQSEIQTTPAILETKLVPAILETKLVVPNNTISAVPSSKSLRSQWILRGDSMYDRRNNTYVCDETFPLDITYLFDWEITPLSFREWATYLGGAMYLSDVAQDTLMSDRMLGLASTARSASVGYNIRNGGFSARRHGSRVR
jgi:hypothetical protein